MLIPCLKPVVQILKLFNFNVERVDDCTGTIACGTPTGCCPVLCGKLAGFLLLVELNGFHDLTDDTVGKNHNGSAVDVCKVECILHEINGFLNGSGSENDGMVIAVSAAAGCLEIVALGGLNGTQSGAAANHVNNNTGKLCACKIGHALLLKADSGAGGACHAPCTGSCCAVDHVDCSNFALCLEEAAAHLGKATRHVFGNIVLGSDGITEEVVAACLNSSFCNSFAALHQFLCHVLFLLLFFNGDNCIGAGACAACAGNTCFGVSHHCGVITLFVELLFCKLKKFLGTCTHTEAAALAAILING